MGETVEQVFEALLKDWRVAEQWGIDAMVGVSTSYVAEQEADADRKIELWRKRFRSAINW